MGRSSYHLFIKTRSRVIRVRHLLVYPFRSHRPADFQPPKGPILPFGIPLPSSYTPFAPHSLVRP